jgi:hypothetical protein
MQKSHPDCRAAALTVKMKSELPALTKDGLSNLTVGFFCSEPSCGERGRNRTFNLPIAQQSAKCLLFQRLLDFQDIKRHICLDRRVETPSEVYLNRPARARLR